MPANADFWYNSKAHRLNQCKQKEYTEQKSNKRNEYNSISMNLQVKVVHVLAEKSVKYNVRVIFHHLYSSKLFYSGFYMISKNI